MRAFLFPSLPIPAKPIIQTFILKTITVSLSLSLLASPQLTASAAETKELLLKPNSVELCEETEKEEEVIEERSVTNEELVEEAWEVVNEAFLPYSGVRPWSPELWLQKKEDIQQNKVQTRSRAHDTIRKMLASLGDPYTRFLSPPEFAKMAKYDMTGIGVNLKEMPAGADGLARLKVLGIIFDGPAHAAGIRQGDEILSVNGIDVRGKSAFDVSALLQGPKETFVTIQVKHGKCGPVESLKVERQSIAKTPVFYRLEKTEKGDSVGYIRIKEFNALAKKDLVIALKRLQNSGASYFVLDLRDNLGGLVQSGIETAKLFLDKGETIIFTAGRDPQVQSSIVTETDPLITTPLIVMVNDRTASASEIVASALHDNCKAVLVGQRTFGKGLIQSVFELHDGSGVVVTIGKYVTPKEMDINGNGIEPDFDKLPGLNKVKEYLSQCQFRRTL